MKSLQLTHITLLSLAAMLSATSAAPQMGGDSVMEMPVDIPAEPPLPEETKRDKDDGKDKKVVAERVATAHVTGDVDAKFMFIWKEGKGMHVEITDMKNFDDIDTKGYSYSINTNTIGSDSADIENQATRCVGTMGRLDPAGVTNNLICDPNFSAYCQIGDLSGKHGKINPREDGKPKDIKYIDDYLRFYPQPFSLLGRSVVIEGKNGLRVGCGNIISKLDGTADDRGAATNKKSTYQNDYPAAAVQPATTAINIASGTGINSKGIQDASLVVPPKIPAASDAAGIVLVKSNGKADVVKTTYDVSGTILPTQPVQNGAGYNTAALSVALAWFASIGFVAELI